MEKRKLENLSFAARNTAANRKRTTNPEILRISENFEIV